MKIGPLQINVFWLGKTESIHTFRVRNKAEAAKFEGLRAGENAIYKKRTLKDKARVGAGIAPVTRSDAPHGDKTPDSGKGSGTWPGA